MGMNASRPVQLTPTEQACSVRDAIGGSTAPESAGDPPCDRRADKTFATLSARAALLGWQLWRSDAADGPQRFFAGRWGLVRVLHLFDDVEQFLDLAIGKAREPR